MNPTKYPKARKFLLETGMTVDEALEFLKNELERHGVDDGLKK